MASSSSHSDSLVAGFERQVKATPDAVALEDDTVTLTYRQLEEKTARLAALLQTKYMDNLPGSSTSSSTPLIGILMGRSADYVISALASLRAGGAFLVLELAYPESLLNGVIEDARPAVILTHTAHQGKIRSPDVPVLSLNSESAIATLAEVPVTDLKSIPHDSDRLAFVSYSSGTTGRPKGIANPIRAAYGSYMLRFGVSDLGPDDRVACNVFFIWEILRPLLKGAAVVVVSDAISYDPESLLNFLAARKITDTLMTPTLLAAVLARHAQSASASQPLPLAKLRSLWLNGEVVTVDLCRRAMTALPNTRLYNVYSASETHEVSAGDIGKMLPTLDPSAGVCPVGPLLQPENVYIVDAELDKLVEAGGVGELCVGGPLLANGYLNLPEATAKAFVPNKFSGKGRLYRTGDSARVADGLLYITGRIGGMIKTRGYTVQPGAVETAILKHLAVRNCAVVSHGEGLDMRLVAYIVRDSDLQGRVVPQIDAAHGHSPSARKALVEYLAHYMIPSVWIEMDKLPTHAVSGKIDTKSLPEPPASRPSSPTSASIATGARQIRLETIVEAWAASLNMMVEAIDSSDMSVNFFDLGGHSLTLAALAGRLTRAFGFKVSLTALAIDASLKGHLAAVTAARDGHLMELQADLPAVLRGDCELASDIRPQMKPRHEKLVDAKEILLTGATGYLGAFLLRTLIASTRATIVCLVRFPQPSESCKPAGMARIRDNLIGLGLWHDDLVDRIEVLPGNLPQARLGLSEQRFAELAKRVSVIIHGAAVVNLAYPYGALRAANVGGTREMLKLASLGGASMHFISSNGVLPASSAGWEEGAVIGADEATTKLADGYCQTKWVAEQLCLQARERGLDVSIVRPGTLSGCSKTGSSNAWDMLNALIVESIRLGHSPQVDGWYCEMTPVNHVANAMVALYNDNSEKRRSIPVFHIGDRQPLTGSQVFDILANLGYPTRRIPWDDWVEMWQASTAGDEKASKEVFTTSVLRGSLPSEEGLKDTSILDDSVTRAHLENNLGVMRPPSDEALWRTYSRHFYARGWLPWAPKRLENSHLKQNGI